MKLKVIWHICIGVLYLATAYGVISASNSKFETLVLAILVQIYTAMLYNFSLIGASTDGNNYAGFVRFRILATAQGVTENEDGLLVDQEKTLRQYLENNGKIILINRISHGVVSMYALYKIVSVVLFG
jgi:hypothetical protein